MCINEQNVTIQQRFKYHVAGIGENNIRNVESCLRSVC